MLEEDRMCGRTNRGANSSLMLASEHRAPGAIA